MNNCNYDTSGGNSDYPTKNTGLAAFLRSEGFKLLDVVPSDRDNPAVFYFEDTEMLRQCAHLWQTGRAHGNISDFFESYRKCLRMVKVGKL